MTHTVPPAPDGLRHTDRATACTFLVACAAQDIDTMSAIREEAIRTGRQLQLDQAVGLTLVRITSTFGADVLALLEREHAVHTRRAQTAGEDGSG